MPKPTVKSGALSTMNQLYREEILDLWRNPVNYGQIDGPDLEAWESNPLCGDEVRIQMKLEALPRRAQSRIAKVRFSGSGCAISQASASMLTQLLEGKTLSQAAQISSRDLLDTLGISPGPVRLKCVTLSLAALKKALGDNEKEITG